MNCGRFEKLIDSYLDGQLSGTLLSEFHAHRLNCRRCSRTVSMLQAAGDVIAQDRCEPKISLDFADRIVAALPAAQKVNRSVWLVRLAGGVAGVAAAAAIVLAVLMAGQMRPHAILGKVAVAPDSGIAIPKGSENIVVRQTQTPVEDPADANHSGTLLDGKVIRDAVDRVSRWYEADRQGQ